jgi:hypothetical protein
MNKSSRLGRRYAFYLRVANGNQLRRLLFGDNCPEFAVVSQKLARELGCWPLRQEKESHHAH